MELRHLRYFLAVAEERNFTRAAVKVGIGQPPLSQQIRALEDEIGTPLFHRVPHGAELTEAGSAFLPRARTILRESHEAKIAAQRASRGETGRLRVGFSVSAAFNPAVPAPIRNFRHAYPGVQLSLVEANTLQLLDLLQRGGIDIGFIRPGPDDPENLRLHRFRDEPMLAVLPAAHPLAARESLPLSALAGESFVLYPRTVGLGLYDEVITCCRKAGFTPRPAIGFEPELVQEAPQLSSVINLVAAEMGVSLVPGSMARVRVPGVVYVPFSGEAPVARLACAVRRGEWTATAHNFMALASRIEG